MDWRRKIRNHSLHKNRENVFSDRSIWSLNYIPCFSKLHQIYLKFWRIFCIFVKINVLSWKSFGCFPDKLLSQTWNPQANASGFKKKSDINVYRVNIYFYQCKISSNALLLKYFCCFWSCCICRSYYFVWKISKLLKIYILKKY